MLRDTITVDTVAEAAEAPAPSAEVPAPGQEAAPQVAAAPPAEAPKAEAAPTPSPTPVQPAASAKTGTVSAMAATPPKASSGGAAAEPHEETGEHDLGAGFSETQWFMAAVDPDSLKEEVAAPDEVMELQDKYRRDDSISEEKRSLFSLRRKKKSK